MKDLSILVVTFNRVADTLELLKNLAGQKDIQSHVLEILLLNNASTDDYSEVEEFIQLHPSLPVKYTHHTENLGVARGRNYLIERAKGKYLLVLDDDVVFARDTAIQTIVGLFDKPHFVSNNTAIITLDIFYYDTGARQVNAFPHKNIRKYEGRDWFLTYYFTGAAHLMKSELFEKTGLYPEDFFYGMEEYDLSYRVIDAGYSLAYDNSVKVLHKESPLGRLPHREKLTMMWLNKARVVWTYLPVRYFFSSFFLWSLFYLKSSKWDFSGCVKNYFKGFKVFSFPRRPLRRVGLLYLKKVEARLWY